MTESFGHGSPILMVCNPSSATYFLVRTFSIDSVVRNIAEVIADAHIVGVGGKGIGGPNEDYSSDI
jgi:hypothetical protein